MLRLTLSFLLALTLLPTGDALAEEPGSAPAVGKAYPPLRLPTIDGKQTLELKQFRGKRVLLLEFASW